MKNIDNICIIIGTETEMEHKNINISRSIYRIQQYAKEKHIEVFKIIRNPSFNPEKSYKSIVNLLDHYYMIRKPMTIIINDENSLFSSDEIKNNLFADYYINEVFDRKLKIFNYTNRLVIDKDSTLEQWKTVLGKYSVRVNKRLKNKEVEGTKLERFIKLVDWDNEVLFLGSTYIHERFPEIFTFPDDWKIYKTRKLKMNMDEIMDYIVSVSPYIKKYRVKFDNQNNWSFALSKYGLKDTVELIEKMFNKTVDKIQKYTKKYNKEQAKKYNSIYEQKKQKKLDSLKKV